MKRLALLVGLCACARAAPSPRAGERRAPGPGRDLLAAPRTGAAVYLRAPRHPEGPLIPADVWLGELTLVPPAGPVRALGIGATNLAGEVVFSPDGRSVAFLRHFDLATHQGELALADLGSTGTRSLAAAASYFGYSPDGRFLGYVEGGRLWLAELRGGNPRKVGDSVATFEFSSDGQAVLYRRLSAAGSELILAASDGAHPSTTVARGVADYRFDRKGQAIAYTVESADQLPELHLWKGGRERLLGTGAPSFEFSPDGRILAYVAGVSARYLEGDLFAIEVEGGKPQRIGQHAGSYSFSPEGSRVVRLAFLRDYYDQARSGKLALWSPGQPVRAVANSVRLFGWSHHGGELAYLETVTHPLYTQELFLLSVEGGAAAGPAAGAGPAPRFIGQAIYSFDFTPDDERLLFKTACTTGGEACDLLSVPTSSATELATSATDGGVVGPKPTRVVAGVSDYDYSPDGRWIWVTFANPISHSFDLAVIPAKVWSLPRYVDRRVDSHPRWLADGRLAYLVSEPRRAGVYVADPSKAAAVGLNR